MKEKEDLSLNTMEELINEIAKRTNGMVITFKIDRTPTEEDIYFFYRRGPTMCLGLIERAKARLLQILLND